MQSAYLFHRAEFVAVSEGVICGNKDIARVPDQKDRDLVPDEFAFRGRFDEQFVNRERGRTRIYSYRAIDMALKVRYAPVLFAFPPESPVRDDRQ